MNLGFISTRLAGTDGVSLETAKWATIFQRMGHQVYYCAGELDDEGPPGLLVPESHFTHPDVKWIHDHAFGTTRATPELRSRIAQLSGSLKESVSRFVTTFDLEGLITENALTIPMNVPLGLALAEYITETDVPTIAHHHDFYWERERFRVNCISDIMDRAFPPDLPSIGHVVINTPAQQSLRKGRGVESTVVPNVFDFASAAPGLDDFNRDLRETLGLTDDHLMILQPTRIVRRKGIELAVELVCRLREPDNLRRLGKEPVLVLTHHSGDEGPDYLEELQRQARHADVPLICAPELFGSSRAGTGSQKVYSLWDAYVHADFVTYPSLYEGFGNALLETIYFRLPALVNR